MSVLAACEERLVVEGEGQAQECSEVAVLAQSHDEPGGGVGEPGGLLLEVRGDLGEVPDCGYIAICCA